MSSLRGDVRLVVRWNQLQSRHRHQLRLHELSSVAKLAEEWDCGKRFQVHSAHGNRLVAGRGRSGSGKRRIQSMLRFMQADKTRSI